MLVSVVERQTWKRCRRKWLLTSETQGNLAPKGLAPALKLGGMIQEALSYWQEHPKSDPLETFKQLSNAALNEYKLNYLGIVGADPNEEELDKLYELIELGLGMTTNYRDYYKTPLPPGFKVIQTEQRTVIDIPNTSHWECNNCHWICTPRELLRLDLITSTNWNHLGRPSDPKTDFNNCPVCEGIGTVSWQNHQLRGTMDSLVQHEKTGKIYCLERKTYGARPNPEKLKHDDQMLAYDWILYQLFGAQAVGGTLYDGLWKRAKVPNSKTKGRPTNMNDMFYRDIFTRPPEERAEFETLLKQEVEDMVDAIQLERFYINRPWMGCENDCGVIRLCNAMSRGEDTDYVRATYYKPRDFGSILDEQREE